jgi:hypothetical protein
MQSPSKRHAGAILPAAFLLCLALAPGAVHADADSFLGFNDPDVTHGTWTVTLFDKIHPELGTRTYTYADHKVAIVSARIIYDLFTDQSWIKVVDGLHKVRWLSQAEFGSQQKAAPTRPTETLISNDADAFDAACDHKNMVVVGANSPTPVSLVDLGPRTEVATLAYPNKLARAVAIDDAGGQAIVVLDNPANNTANEIRRVRIAAGTLTDSGESLALGADFTTKVLIAPGARFGVAIVGVGTSRLVSFSLPGLAIKGSVTLGGGTGNAVVFNHAGDRVYVRSGRRAIAPDVIEGFSFDRVTGAIGQAPVLRINNVAAFTDVPFVNSMALSSDGASLVVTGDETQPGIFRYDTGTGTLLGMVPTAERQRGVSTRRPCAKTQEAVEYYHAGFDHYFVTTLAPEIALLDAGTTAGWVRTGERFLVYGSGSPATAPTCRFFSTAFDPKSSHFYTPVAAECASLKAGSKWQFEGEVFNMTLPGGDGSCLASEIPLYRLYNAGQGGAPNHRYATSLEVRAQMVTRGWTPEGNGIGVIGCIPAAPVVAAGVNAK